MRYIYPQKNHGYRDSQNPLRGLRAGVGPIISSFCSCQTSDFRPPVDSTS